MAIPLRVLEVFIVSEDIELILKNNANRYLEDIFTYLIKNRYLQHLKHMIEEKIPPMVEPSAVPPTPIAKCIMDMIKRPLKLVHHLDNSAETSKRTSDEFSVFVLSKLCESVLSPKMSEPIKMFIVPALGEFQEFPYVQLINCINRFDVQPTMSLLYCVLTLEPAKFCLGQSKQVLINYLQALATMSSMVTTISAEQTLDTDSDSDSNADAEMTDEEECDILRQCIEMFNEEHRVQNLLAAVDHNEDSSILQPLCQLCHNLLITGKLAIHKYKLLYMLAFKPTFLQHLWSTLLSTCQISFFGGATSLLSMISRGIALTPEDTKKIVPLLAVFCSLLSLLIATLHDSEFFVEDDGLEAKAQQPMPFTISNLVMLTSQLKQVCLGLVELAFPDTRPTVREGYRNVVFNSMTAKQTQQETQIWAHLFKVTVTLLRQLHTRDLRRQFCPDGHWIASNVVIPVDKPQELTFRRRRLRGYVPFQGLRAFTREELEEGPPLSAKEVRTLTLLREVPFVVPFNERVMVFQSLIYKDKMEQQGDSHFLQGPSIQISVRRNYLYEDAFDKLRPENEPEMRLKMRVQLVNSAGLEEAGVDGGGLFREFLSELLKTSFDPNRGFFRLTKDNMLYPNPTVHLLVEDFPKHYYFIGRVLGKALYENLLVELPFAEFFLSKIVGRQSNVDVHHLASLDPIMYR